MENTMILQVLIMAVVSKTDISRKIPNYFKFVTCKKMNLNVRSFLSSQNIFHDLKRPKVKYNLHHRCVRGDFLRPPHGTASSCSDKK